MASLKTIHISNDLKSFSSHPGHGSASKTVAQFEVAADQTRQFFPAEVAQERQDHNAKGRKNP